MPLSAHPTNRHIGKCLCWSTFAYLSASMSTYTLLLVRCTYLCTSVRCICLCACVSRNVATYSSVSICPCPQIYITPFIKTVLFGIEIIVSASSLGKKPKIWMLIFKVVQLFPLCIKALSNWSIYISSLLHLVLHTILLHKCLWQIMIIFFPAFLAKTVIVFFSYLFLQASKDYQCCQKF